MFYVYFLKLNNGQICTGYTENLKRRKSEHDLGKVASTMSRLPCCLVGYEAYALKTDAMRREKFLKTTEGKKLFKQQYRDIITSVVPR
ncbi:MAG: GIY-YIG nuclease family protein [Candidatus Saccharibacteria bacterium]|nr:GIY-YIG nuclease family protein [Candidatus Saccharibacteria bacterium]